MHDEIEDWHLTTAVKRFSIPPTPALRSLYTYE
jgi:hypothetical protein